jgi:hypothetical protein
VQLHREQAAFRRAGADLVFVGNGAPHFGKAFAEDFGITAPIYVDVQRAAYRALGMHRRGLSMLLSRGTLAAALRALRAGFVQGATRGDALQLGGVLVVRPGGEVVFRHLSGYAGDHPPVASVLAAAGAVPAPAMAT